MTMDLDPGYLIRRKVIVNNHGGRGACRFNTPRKKSGEVPELARKNREKRKKAPTCPKRRQGRRGEGLRRSFSMPSPVPNPDVEAILAREPLASVNLAAGLEKKIRTEQTRWEKELTRLADEKTLADYRVRVEKLKGTGGSLGSILGAAGEAKQLQADIQKDLNLLKNAKKSFTADFKSYQNELRDLSKAPLKEINRIMEKYSLSPAGLANMSQLIFGQRLCGWVQTASNWYQKVQPYMDRVPVGAGGKPEKVSPLRGKGQNIRFAETPPCPTF